ncbi:hypothetical protein ACHAXT_010604 [Thalassiosira profunda]
MRRSRSTETVDTSAATAPIGSESMVPLNDTAEAKAAGSNRSAGSNKSTGSGSSRKSEYLKYLNSYEGMVRHQDLEFDATSAHVKGVFERVQTLGGKKNADGELEGDDAAPTGMLTYLQMRRCLLRMGMGWHRSLPASGDAAYDDDDVSVLSFNSTSSGRSGLSGGGGRDIIATDAQLIMLLATLVETEERGRAAKDPAPQSRGWTKNIKSKVLGYRGKKERWEEGIFLPEFVQAYKLIIGGMQSLKCIANPDDPAKASLCSRLKDRTVGMLRPFGTDAALYSDPSQKTGGKDDALSKSGLRSTVGDMSSETKKKLGFSGGEARQLLRSKDMTLQKIVEDHESEMDALAYAVEELRAKEERTRKALRRRKRRARWAALLLGSVVIGGGVALESHRRQYLADELQSGREAERVADAKTIAKLSEERRDLEEQLGVIEGKRRYQVNRNDEMEANTQSIAKKVDDLELKWLLDKAEAERCSASLVGMTEELKRAHSKQGEVDEERVWCQSRLRSQERELNELQHFRVDPSDRTGDSTKTQRPVYLEMKFSKSMRNSMRLRQAYAAVAGLAVGALLQGVVPLVFRLLFVPKVVVPPPLPTHDVEMMIVDGIFGSSVAFLLIKGIATMFMPL